MIFQLWSIRSTVPLLDLSDGFSASETNWAVRKTSREMKCCGGKCCICCESHNLAEINETFQPSLLTNSKSMKGWNGIVPHLRHRKYCQLWRLLIIKTWEDLSIRFIERDYSHHQGENFRDLRLYGDPASKPGPNAEGPGRARMIFPDRNPIRQNPLIFLSYDIVQVP